MATNNFHNVNASKIFACEIEEDYEYDDLVLNLSSSFDHLNFEEFDPNYSPSDELRSFPARTLGRVTSPIKIYGGLHVYAEVEIIIRSGYYAGVNLDWKINYICDDKHDSVEDIDFEWLFENKHNNYKSWITSFLENQANMLVEEVERIYEEYTTPLRTIAVASNGEAFYEKA